MTSITRSWTRTLSNLFVPEATGRLSITSLVLLGCVAGLLHVHLRYPMNIPGHHGIEWMALVMFGRLLSNHRFAAGILASGAASSYLVQSPFFNLAHDVKPALIFLLSGIFVDVFYRFRISRLPMIVNAAGIAALAFVTKPAVMYALYIFTGMSVGMFIKHPDYLPFVSHLVFGAVGGAGGAILAAAADLKIQKRGQTLF